MVSFDRIICPIAFGPIVLPGFCLGIQRGKLYTRLLGKHLSSVTNDSFCYKLLKSLLLIGYQQIWSLIFVIEKYFVKRVPGLKIKELFRDANRYGFAVFVTVLMLLLRRYGQQSKGYGETINKSTL